MIALRQQGVSWDKVEEAQKVAFSEAQYHELQARYADLDKANRDPSAKKPKFDIDPMLVSGDTLVIDKTYLMKLLNDLAQAQATEQAEQAQALEAHILPLFNQLRENDRLHAERILADVKSGKIKQVDNFEVLLDQYRANAEQATVSDFIALFGLDRTSFQKLQAHHVLGKDDWKDFGLLDNLVKSADMERVKQQFLAENPNTPTDLMMLSFLLEKRIKEEVEKVILAR